MAEPPAANANELAPDGADRIRQARLDKLERLEAAGVRPYPTQVQRTHRAGAVLAGFDDLEGQQVCVVGRLGVFKSLGKNLAFVFLSDESGQIQLIFHPRNFDEQSRTVYDALDPGDF